MTLRTQIRNLLGAASRMETSGFPTQLAKLVIVVAVAKLIVIAVLTTSASQLGPAIAHRGIDRPNRPQATHAITMRVDNSAAAGQICTEI